MFEVYEHRLYTFHKYFILHATIAFIEELKISYVKKIVVGNILFLTNIKLPKETLKNFLILALLLPKMQNCNIPKSLHKTGI